jgi:hypothetical protein
VVVDRGYQNPDHEHALVIGFDGQDLPRLKQDWNKLVASVRNDVERVLAYIKRFREFQYTYLKSMPVHSLLFQLACHVVNARFEKYPLRKQGPHPNLFGAVMQKPE